MQRLTIFKATIRSSVLGRLYRHRMGRAGMIIIGTMVFIALFADLISPYDPAIQDPQAELQAPSASKLFGTDQFGRDVLSRTLHATRTALLIGGLAAAGGGLLGVVFGILAGYYGGITQSLIVRSADVVLAFPGILLALLLVSILGVGTLTVGMALAIGSAPIFVRLARASCLQIKEREYVLAARLFGASSAHIMLRHILPNSISPILIQMSLVIGISVLTESGLSFLGLGIQPPSASWGLMLNEGRLFINVAPWITVAPGAFLATFLIGLILVADGLRDVLDVGEAAVHD